MLISLGSQNPESLGNVFLDNDLLCFSYECSAKYKQLNITAPSVESVVNGEVLPFRSMLLKMYGANT